jgi:hypothetical protein
MARSSSTTSTSPRSPDELPSVTSAYRGINSRIDEGTRAEDTDLDDDLDEDGSTRPSP